MTEKNLSCFQKLKKIFCVQNEYSNFQKLNEFESFYHNFMDLKEISEFKVVESSFSKIGSFVKETYNIRIKIDENEFIINKNFQEFIDFFEMIKSKYDEFSNSDIDFFKKEFVLIWSSEASEERKKNLNVFLQKLLKVWKEKKIYEFLEFSKLKNFKHKIKFQKDEIEFFKSMELISNSKEDEFLLNLLWKLNKEEDDRISNLEKIKIFLFENHQVISPQINEILIRGSNQTEGLLDICGKCKANNHVVCCYALGFLCSLFDYEKNAEAEFFLKIFVDLPVKEFAKLNLASHIVEKPSRNCKKYALKLLEIYKNGNPRVDTFLFSQMLNNEDAYSEFEKWKISKKEYSQTDRPVITKDEMICCSKNLHIIVNEMKKNDKKVKSALFSKKNQN